MTIYEIPGLGGKAFPEAQQHSVRFDEFSAAAEDATTESLHCL